MKLTDEKVLALIKKADSVILEDGIKYYPEDEVEEGTTDLKFALDEVNHIIDDCFNDDGHRLYHELKGARQTLRETEDGKVIPIDMKTFLPLIGYRPEDIEDARCIVNEYKRLKKLQSSLRRMYWKE